MGKTSLLHQYVHKTFYEDYRTTLGASILTKVLAVDNTPLKLQVSGAATLILQARVSHRVLLSPSASWCDEVGHWIGRT